MNILPTTSEGEEEEEEEKRRFPGKDMGSTSLVLRQPTKGGYKSQGRNRNNTTENLFLSCEIIRDDNQKLLINKLSVYRQAYFPNRLEVLYETANRTPSLSLGEFAVSVLQRYDPDSIVLKRGEHFRNLIQTTSEKLFNTGSRKHILFNKHTVYEINQYDLSQNANTTPEPETDKESIFNEINESESASMIEIETTGQGSFVENQNPATEEASTSVPSQLSFEDKFGHLSIFAQQNNPGKESDTKLEEIAKSAINGMLAKCIESLHKPTVNSRLSGRNARTLVSNMNTRHSISKMRRCSTQEIAHLQNELERKFSTEKNNLESENDFQFSHGDGESLHHSADDIEQSTENVECLRRQRMERLQQLRNVLEQKKGEQKESDNRSKLKSEMEPNRETEQEEYIDEDGEGDEENEGTIINKAPTHTDVHIAPPRRGIKSIYREVECVQSSSCTENEIGREGCDDDSCPLGLSGFNVRTHVDAKKETKPESRSSISTSRHSSATINRCHSPTAEKSKQDTHIGLPCDEIASALDSENREPKTETDLCSKYTKTGINGELGAHYQKSQTILDVPESGFWKDLNDAKLGNTGQLMHNSEENVDVSQWVTTDLCPLEENEIGNFFQDSFKSSRMQLDKFTNSVAYPAELPRQAKPEKMKTNNNLTQEVKEKTKKKEIGQKTSGCVSLKAETKSVLQKRAYFENEAHLEESDDKLEEKRKELRDAENLLFFRAMAKEAGFLQPIGKVLPRPLGFIPKNHTPFKSFAKMNSRLSTPPSDVDKSVLSTSNRRRSSILPDDYRNYISENQAEENLMFFRYIARNKSFFKFNEGN